MTHGTRRPSTDGLGWAGVRPFGPALVGLPRAGLQVLSLDLPVVGSTARRPPNSDRESSVANSSSADQRPGRGIKLPAARFQTLVAASHRPRLMVCFRPICQMMGRPIVAIQVSARRTRPDGWPTQFTSCCSRSRISLARWGRPVSSPPPPPRFVGELSLTRLPAERGLRLGSGR